MKVNTQAIESKAEFSFCKRWRYSLTRTFEKGAGTINFIMLNPSTADEDYNDPTVARCERLAIELGFERMVITNLFAYRATDPKAMLADSRAGVEVIGGRRNDAAIMHAAAQASKIVCAWGNHGAHLERSRQVIEMLRPYAERLHYLEINQSGEPKHPLYISGDTMPTLWEASHEE